MAVVSYTTRCIDLEDSHLFSHCRENLGSYANVFAHAMKGGVFLEQPSDYFAP
jgi:hypothetical protein